MIILSSLPFDGKSTLAWLMAVLCTKGGCEFLGNKVNRCGVLYCNSEETLPDVRRILTRLGYNDTDEKLLVLDLRDVADKFAEIAKCLEANPEIGLVVFETLDDVMEMPDLNSNSDCRRRFKLMDKKLGKYYHRIAIVALHHLKKKKIDSLGSRMIGGTYLRGRTSANWFLHQNSDNDPRRIFSTVVRHGKKIPPTFLNYDEATGVSTLGSTMADERQHSKEETRGATLHRIQEFLQRKPDSTRDQCLADVGGNSRVARDVFDKAVRSCLISRMSVGKKMCHRWVGLPQEVAA